MRALAGSTFLLFCAAAGWAQPHGAIVNPTPFVQGTFGNVVFPGGTASPTVHRSFGNAVFPGGSGPHLVVPGSVTDPTFLFRPGAPGFGVGRQVGRAGAGRLGRGNAVVMPYAVPVYVGGFYDNPYVDEAPALPPPSQQQPNVVIVYPPMQQPIGAAPGGEGVASALPPDIAEPSSAEPAPPEPQQYLIAFKDHTVYAAVAFWFDGDTLHYFTSGNTHNQVSLSLVDKPLTERLNKESGVDMHLP